MERGGSQVEYRDFNRGNPGSNPFCYRFEARPFSFAPQRPNSPGCRNEYLAIDGDGNMSVSIVFVQLLQHG